MQVIKPTTFSLPILVDVTPASQIRDLHDENRLFTELLVRFRAGRQEDRCLDHHQRPRISYVLPVADWITVTAAAPPQIVAERIRPCGHRCCVIADEI